MKAVGDAMTIARYGIHVYLFKESRPRPELSFAIRHLGAYVGAVDAALCEIEHAVTGKVNEIKKI